MIDFSTIKTLTIDNIRLRRLLIDDTLVWRDGMFNWVPVSRDTDGSIYNGTGYQEGYRLSSSGALKAQENTVATGFIPAKYGDVIRMKGVTWGTTVASGYSYIAFYDEDFSLLATVNRFRTDSDNGVSNITSSVIDASTSSILTDSDGVTTFSIAFKTNLPFKYIRISATGAGADMIVTVNEPIIKPIITFIIEGNEYQAEEGMTWDEWAKSEYNTKGYVSAGRITSSGGADILYNNSFVSSTDLIISNGIYTINKAPFEGQ